MLTRVENIKDIVDQRREYYKPWKLLVSTNKQTKWLVGGILVQFEKDENSVLKYEYEYKMI